MERLSHDSDRVTFGDEGTKNILSHDCCGGYRARLDLHFVNQRSATLEGWAGGYDSGNGGGVTKSSKA